MAPSLAAINWWQWFYGFSIDSQKYQFIGVVVTRVPYREMGNSWYIDSFFVIVIKRADLMINSKTKSTEKLTMDVSIVVSNF